MAKKGVKRKSMSSSFNESKSGNDSKAPLYNEGDLVGARVKGYPLWPGHIEKVDFVNSKIVYTVRFFYTDDTSHRHVELKHFKDFTEKELNCKRVGFREALQLCQAEYDKLMHEDKQTKTKSDANDNEDDEEEEKEEKHDVAQTTDEVVDDEEAPMVIVTPNDSGIKSKRTKRERKLKIVEKHEKLPNRKIILPKRERKSAKEKEEEKKEVDEEVIEKGIKVEEEKEIIQEPDHQVSATEPEKQMNEPNIEEEPTPKEEKPEEEKKEDNLMKEDKLNSKESSRKENGDVVPIDGVVQKNEAISSNDKHTFVINNIMITGSNKKMTKKTIMKLTNKIEEKLREKEVLKRKKKEGKLVKKLSYKLNIINEKLDLFHKFTDKLMKYNNNSRNSLSQKDCSSAVQMFLKTLPALDKCIVLITEQKVMISSETKRSSSLGQCEDKIVKILVDMTSTIENGKLPDDIKKLIQSCKKGVKEYKHIKRLVNEGQETMINERKENNIKRKRS